jgi:hypothetical protein
MWYDTSASKLKVYSGTAWSGVGGGATISDTAPTGSISDGDLWYDSASNYRLFIYSSSAQSWIDAAPASTNTTTMTVYRYTATAGQTAFVGADANAKTMSIVTGGTTVFLNGIKLTETIDYTINSTLTTITLLTAAAAGDELSVIIFAAFAVANAMPYSGGTFTGGVTFNKAAIGLPATLTSASTITPDFSLSNYFNLTLGHTATLANPTNLVAGQSGAIVITQDGTGSRTLAYGGYWKFAGGTAPTLTTTAGAVDVLAYYVESTTRITARMISDTK